jgi:MFS family permease
MYFITYVDRVNFNSAAGAFQDELGLNNTRLGLIFSAFAYPYLVFQVIGGWVGDKFGARRVLFVCGLIWAGATILTGLSWSFYSLFFMRLLLGFGEGATFPTATRAMRSWVEPKKYGFAQGITHSFARLGNTITPPLVAALVVATSWRWSFAIIGVISLIWVAVWYWYFRDEPSEHPAITQAELAVLPPSRAGKQTPQVPWGPLIRRMWPVTLTYFCYGWCLWLYLNWIPLFFQRNHDMDIKDSALFASGESLQSHFHSDEAWIGAAAVSAFDWAFAFPLPFAFASVFSTGFALAITFLSNAGTGASGSSLSITSLICITIAGPR